MDWEAFKNTIEITNNDTENMNHTTCTNLITQAYKNSLKHCERKNDAPYWWTDDIERGRDECIRTRRKMTRIRKKKGDCESAMEEYRMARKSLGNLIRGTRRRFWEDLCKELENDIWGSAYKIVLKKLNYLTPYELSVDKKRKIINDLFPLVADGWRLDPVTNPPRPFTEEEIGKAARGIKCGKAPGPDKIPPKAIRIVAECAPNMLMDVMNNLLRTQEFPEEWKTARVVLIPKSEKPPELSSSYRPLCLLNSLSKLLETLIRDRLIDEVKEKGGFHEHQYGFLRGRSTTQAIEKVIDIAKEFKSKWCVLITIDVKNAFNSARHGIIIEELRGRNIDNYLIRFISSYLSNRKVMISKTETAEVAMGVPQGSVLGPVWNVLYDGVLGLELTGDAACVAFADDLALVVGAENENVLMQHTNTCLAEISAWMRDRGLMMEPSKTEAVLMKSKRKHSHVTFHLDGVELHLTKTVRYLGVTIDERGSFGPHVGRVSKKADENITSLARIMPNISGPSSGKRAVIGGAVHNILMYGAPIWHKVVGIQKYRKILERTQRNILLRVASAYRTASLAALQVVTGTVPIDLMVHERAYAYENRYEEEDKKSNLTARDMTLEKWQYRWNNEKTKTQWTKRLIKNIKQWTDCRHRRVDYYMTQMLTAHGCFRAFAKHFGRDKSDECIYCGKTDTAEHTIFECARWNKIRGTICTRLGTSVTPDTIVPLMIQNANNWENIHGMIRAIMQEKESDEYNRQNRMSEEERN